MPTALRMGLAKAAMCKIKALYELPFERNESNFRGARISMAKMKDANAGWHPYQPYWQPVNKGSLPGAYEAQKLDRRP